jgi:hypothetical protein
MQRGRQLSHGLPITANPALADLLEWYCTKRVAYCAKFYNTPPLAALWSFAPYENSGDWQAAPTPSAWLLDAHTAIGAARRATKTIQMGIAQTPKRCRLCC